MNTMAVTALLDVGLETDKETTAAEVQTTANAVNCAKVDDRPLPADVVWMLHLVLDSDLQHLWERSKVTTNVTCMQPTELGLTSAGTSYILDRLTTRPTTTLAWMDLIMMGLQDAAS